MRARHLLLVLAGANLCCASPSPIVPDSLVVEAHRLYGTGDCAALRNTVERTDLSTATPEQQAALDLLVAFCAEREGEILSAKDRYEAVIAKSPRSVQAFEAALRFREMDRLEKEGTTREVLRKRADGARQTPLYQHGAKPVSLGDPTYPPGAAAAGVEGSVLVDFALTREGKATDIVVLASDPPFLFDGVVLDAVRNWAYQPSDRDEPRRVTVLLPFAMTPPPDTPIPVATRVDESELDPVERRGREIFQLTVASARATDALRRTGYLTYFRHFIVVPDGNASLVRFIDDQGKVFADVVVDVFSTELEQVTLHEAPLPLPADQVEMWKARVDAFALGKTRRLGCTPNGSTAVLPSLEPDRSWDVYVLSAHADGQTVPGGGYYRISISRDPGVPPEIHSFGDSCEPPKSSPDSKRIIFTEATASTPTEIHVYLSLRYGRPLGVVVHDDNGLWFVENGRMRRADISTGTN